MARNGAPPGSSGPPATGAPGDHFRFGDVEVDVPAMRVVRAGEPVELEPKIFDLLVFLAANPGRVVGKDEILERVWQGAFVTDNALARAVAQLRRALGDDAAHARYVETVRTRGYRFVATIEALADAASPSQSPLAAELVMPPPAAPGPRRLAGRAVAVTLAALVLVTVALAGSQLLRAGRAGRASRSTIGAPQQLTVSPAYDGGPTFSPDGTHVAYASERGEGALASPEIVVRRLDDGEELQLTDDGGGNVGPTWSPDGRWIAYHSMARGGLWLVSPLGGSPRRLTELGSQPAWSPDSRSVVFCSQNATALAAWSWAATRDALLHVVDVATGEQRQLTRPGAPLGGHGDPAWSPDGGTIVFAAGDQLGQTSLWRVPAAGGEPEPLESSAALRVEGEAVDWRAPTFLDATTLFAVRGSAAFAVWRLPVWGVEGAGEILPVAPAGMGDLALSPDGERLAFATYGMTSRIATVAIGADGAVGPVELVASASQRLGAPRFSPDGARLSYSRLRGGTTPDLVVVRFDAGANAAGLELTELTAIGWRSPTRLVAFAKGGRPQHAPLARETEVVEIDVESGQRRVLALPPQWQQAGSRYRVPFWVIAPDLGRVVFGVRPDPAGATLELFGWRADEPEPRQLTDLGALAEFPGWSADGSTLSFQVSRLERPGQDEVWLVDFEDGEARRLLHQAGRSWGPRLDPTGTRVVYAAQRGGRWDLGIVAVDQPERLLGVNAGYMAYVRWPDWSPLGDRIAFEHTRMTADVWVMPLRSAGR